MSDEAKNRHRRCWWQFGLRSLMLAVLAVAGGLLVCREYLEPYWRQKQTVALVERLSGSSQTVEVDHWWLKLFGGGYNVTQVNLADCDDPDAYLTDIADLPALELLVVGSQHFNDQHLQRLERVKTLQWLVLDSTAVSDEGLAAFHTRQRNAEVYESERLAIEGLRQVGAVHVDTERDDSHALRAWLEPQFFEWAVAVVVAGPRAAEVEDANLIQLECLRRVESLDLSGSAVSNATLSRVSRCVALQMLDLHNTAISDDCMTALPTLRQLKALSLRNTEITDAGAVWLQGLDNLRILRLEGTRVTPAEVAKLRHALPKCVILENR